MSAHPIGLGIVSTGAIAGVIADAIAQSAHAKLIAVSSRKIESARAFTQKRTGVAAVEGIDGLLAHPGIDAIYVATPTAAKEPIALAAIAAGKHVLVDKPFLDHPSVVRMTSAAQAKGVVFMDATHFVHHPRTAAIRAATAEKIGTPQSIHTTFCWPFSDRANIRFDVKQEPRGALADMAWYPMRAIVEFLRPQGRFAKAAAVAERDPETTAVVRAAGLLAFESGETATFDVSYTAGTIVMDLQLRGAAGVIFMDDFVLDWTDSFAFKNPGIPTGYFHKTGMATRQDATFIRTPGGAAEIAMLENFAALVASGDAAVRAAYEEASLKTQEYVDAIWAAAS